MKERKITTLEELHLHLDHIAEMLGDFLKSMGGYSNGYSTAASGYVTQRVYGKIEFETPVSHHLTPERKEEEGRKINALIRTYLEENDLPEVHIKTSHFIEWFYNISIEFVSEKRYIRIKN